MNEIWENILYLVFNILKTKIKGLNLEEVTFDENSLQQFKNIKLEIEKYIQNTKEPNK